MSGIEVWMFGSALAGGESEDIDLLIAYDDSILTVNRAIEVRYAIADLVAEDTGRTADVLLLTRNEMEQTGILSRVTAVRIR